MDIARLLGKDQYDAAMNANAPTAANPFVTIADIITSSSSTTGKLTKWTGTDVIGDSIISESLGSISIDDPNASLFVKGSTNQKIALAPNTQSIVYGNSLTISGQLKGTGLTANRTWNLPDNTGTIALLSDIPAATGDGIYDGSGSLSGPTIVTGGSNSLTIDDLSGFTVQAINGVVDISSVFSHVNISTLGGSGNIVLNSAQSTNITFGTTSIITDGSGSGLGMQYVADYSGTFTGNSLVTKTYVDNTVALATNVYNANGSLTANRTIDGTTAFSLTMTQLSAFSVDAGGTIDLTSTSSNVDIESTNGAINLTSNIGDWTTNSLNLETIVGNMTLVSAANLNATFAGTSTITDSSGNGLGLQYVADYSATFVNESLITKRYVDNAIDVSAVAQTYTPTNVSTDRAYDANLTSLDEIADVLGTLIGDLQTSGIIL